MPHFKYEDSWSDDCICLCFQKGEKQLNSEITKTNLILCLIKKKQKTSIG